MCILRPLVFILFFSVYAKADLQSVIVTGSSSVMEPKSQAATIEEKVKTHIKTWSLNLNKIEMSSTWTMSLDYSQTTADYSQYKIYDFVGTESILANELTEQSVSLDQIWAKGPSIFELILASNMGTTPLRKSNASFIYLYKINAENLWGLSLGFQRQNLPLNYYSNPQTGLREARPEQIDSESFKIYFEHIYSSMFKNRFELIYGRRVPDRPDSYGIGAKNLFVLNDDMGLRVDLGYITEAESESLKNDVGYQSSSWLETKFIHNVDSYWTYGLGYSTEINREKRPWLSQTDQLGNDQVLADLKYDHLKYAASLSVAWAKYNTGQSGTNVKGDLEWKF